MSKKADEVRKILDGYINWFADNYDSKPVVLHVFEKQWETLASERNNKFDVTYRGIKLAIHYHYR